MTSLRAALALSLALGLTTAGVPPARADEVPVEQRLQVERASLAVGGGVVALDVLLLLSGDAPPGTTLQGTVSSCGRDLADGSDTVLAGERAGMIVELFDVDGPNPHMPTTTYPDSDDTAYGITPRDLPSDYVAETFTYRVVVATPGADPYTLTGTSPVDGFGEPPTCAQVDRRFATAIAVTRWSEKRGRPRVGRRVSVTPTVAPAARVAYRWQAAVRGRLRTVGKGPSIRFQREYRRYLQLVVTISQPGRRTVRETISYG